MQKLRNVAIIAHVDHGKTTLVDCLLHQVKMFRDNQEVKELILDSNDLEKERGITILSKNVSVRYKDTKINIIDTPGHSDFGGEVERVLNMVDGVLLLVDAFEGPMPQTRFVLQKAIQMGLKPLVVINKVDKPNCTPTEVYEKVFDLMFSLDATEEQLDFPVIYGSSKHGWMSEDFNQPTEDVSYLLDKILEHIAPPKLNEGHFQMKITSIDYSSFIGKIAIGRINRGSVKPGQKVALMRRDGQIQNAQVKKLYSFEGLGKHEIEDGELASGEICAINGLDAFDIGDTIADAEHPEALPRIDVDEPTLSMMFTINNSPFYGKEGKFLTSRHIRERLFKEAEINLALKIEETDSPEKLLVYGRGILHLSVLVETMRREGYEFQLGQPQVVIKTIDGKKHEPVEALTVQVDEELASKVIDLVTQRKGNMNNYVTNNGRSNLEFDIPARALIGLTNNLLTATQGEAIIAHRFKEFAPWKGDLQLRRNGSLISLETGAVSGYSVNKLKDRGTFFVEPTDEVYEGQVIGENNKGDDLTINLCTTKKLTNMRSSGADDKVVIAPALKFSLEEAMEYIKEDEYLELTPDSMRIRKILLKEHERKRAKNPALN